MKIAKKLLAAVVALMLVCSLGVCAFATQSAETGDLLIESDWNVGTKAGKSYIMVKVYFVDAVDLKSWDLVLHYDADVFNYMSKSAGADAKAVASYCDAELNSYTDNFNAGTDGEIALGGYFLETLWTSEKFLENSNFDGDCIVNDEKFEAVIFYLEVEDMAAFESTKTVITMDGNLTFVDKKAVSSSISHGTDVPATDAPATDAPATDAPATDAPATDAPATDAPATRPIGGNGAGKGEEGKGEGDNDCHPGKPGHNNCKPGKPVCKPGKPSHKHPNTGDGAALAAAAGVVLLAGAAFVVSKKRK